MKSMNMGKMFKKLESSHILGCIALVVLVWALMTYSNNKSVMGYSNYEKSNHAPLGVTDEMPDMAANLTPSSSNNSVAPHDLLPSGSTTSAPTEQIGGMNFLKAGHHVGINTVSSSLRNANYQLRADPGIPKQHVGPWNGSTIDQDLERKPLDHCGN